MDLLKAKICEISVSIAERLNLFLIDVIIRGHERNRVIEIYFDSERNLDAETCALLSREINKEIELQQLINSQYRLEVSSPGVERPLKYKGQYPKHINRNFEVIYKDAEEEKKILVKLLTIDGDDFIFETKKKELIKINFNNIIKAKVNISFS